MSTLKVALSQMAPVWLDRDATLARVVERVNEAAAQGVRLVAFGEALVPGYPFWVEHTGGALFESRFQKAMFAHYANQAVQIERGDLAPVCRAARAGGLWVILGTIERPPDRGGHSLYCSLVVIDDQGEVRNVHRKLMPTYEERLVWSTGDGHGLRAFDLDGFKLGALNCWENWMPLARCALYSQGVNVHVAIWPGSVRNTVDITRFIAREGRSYVLSVCGLLRREDIPPHIPHAAAIREALPEVSANGGSCVCGPDGQWIVPPCADESRILFAELDLTRIREERHNFDAFGHYSRPDVLKLSVSRQRQTGVDISD
jgi:nitrilase